MSQTLPDHPSPDPWDALLRDVVDADPGVRIPYPLSLFATRHGVNWSGDLMVIGRAVGAWHHDVTPADLATPEARGRAIHRELADARSEECPLDFVRTQWRRRIGRSAFWRVVWRTCEGLGIGEGDRWPSALAWSHLYRLTGQRGGNPSVPLARLQRTSCLNLLATDLEALAPRRLLFLTGSDWSAPFVDGLGMTLDPVTAPGVTATGDWNGMQVVVADHPQCRPEVPMTAAIVEAFGAGDGPVEAQ